MGTIGVDIYAPGRDIPSDWYKPSNNGKETLSGTSMASAHVAGLVLCLIAQDPDRFNSPTAITSGLITFATRNSRAIPSGLIAFNGLSQQ